ncbi:MAG: glycosyltransferase family 4 protein [Acidobacteriota bacterium]
MNDDRPRALKLLYLVEGYTDIRFVIGLSEISQLTMIVPERQYFDSGLAERVAQADVSVDVIRIRGGRAAFQVRSLATLLRIAGKFDVILSQEMLRGSLNANVAGRLRHVPVVTYMAMPPLQYFRCRTVHGPLGRLRSIMGELVIGALMTINGRLSSRSLALGPYLQDIVSKFSGRTGPNHYYGVDTTIFRPASKAERAGLRRLHDLPGERPLIFLASRISHEKDPKTALAACALLRKQGVDLVLLNLSGGWREFLELARSELGSDAESWVIARPAAHPILEVADYFRAADVTVQASLEEGLGLSPLESLACGTPVVATDVGGMGRVLPPYALLTPPRAVEAMASAIRRALARSPETEAMTQAGLQYVIANWSRDAAFSELKKTLRNVVSES